MTQLRRATYHCACDEVHHETKALPDNGEGRIATINEALPALIDCPRCSGTMVRALVETVREVG